MVHPLLQELVIHVLGIMCLIATPAIIHENLTVHSLNDNWLLKWYMAAMFALGSIIYIDWLLK